MMLGIQFVQFALLSPVLSLLPYYIQTDEGDDRFFQFSSGEGGQYRRETVLGNGTVTGSYSWKDDEGMVRFYLYTADRAGYRVKQVNVMEEEEQDQENSVDNFARDGGRRESRKQNYDPRAKNSLQRQQMLKKKVLVKKKKKSNVMGMKSSSARPHVIVKRLGLAAEVVPYIPPEERQQAEKKGGLRVLFASQGEERQNKGKTRAARRRGRGWKRQLRFVELPRRAERREDKGEVERSARRRSGQGEESELPTTRLLGKVKVGSMGKVGNVGKAGKAQVGRRGRMLRRRRVGRRRKRKSWYQTTFL